MNTIKIFLALSANEFEQEMNELGNYIQQLNGLYRPKGVFFELVTSEEFEKSGQTEEEKTEIENSQYFYVIFGADAEESVVDDFDVALESFNEHDLPRVYTYFRKVLEGEKASERVEEFLQRLDEELGHYYSQFETIDSIKLNMILEIARNSDDKSDVKFEDGMLKLDGKDVISLKDIPFYSRNERLRDFIEEKRRLDEEFVRLADEYSKGNTDALIELSKIGAQKEKTGELIRQIENDMYELYSSIIEHTSSGETVTWRVKEARKRLEEGDYDAALTILQDEEREIELDSAEAAIDRNVDVIKGYMSENRLRIETLRAQGITVETIPKIIECYKKNTDLAKKYNIDTVDISEYYIFLYQQGRYAEAISEIEWLRNYLDAIDDERKANTYQNLAVLCKYMQRFEEAEDLFNEAIEIYCRLIDLEPDPGEYLSYLAVCYDNLASLYSKMQRRAEAEELYKRALSIKRKLIDNNPEECARDIANSCSNLAVLYYDMDRFDESEELYEEALNIRRELSESNPDLYEGELAQNYNNLANLYAITGRFEEAEQLQEKSLVIRRKLSGKNPEAYENEVAESCMNMANIYWNTERFGEAQKLFIEALGIFRKLSEKNPEVYEERVAICCYNLADLYEDIKCFGRAEGKYKEAFGIFSRLSEVNSKAYENYVVMCCDALADLYDEMDREEDAKLFRNKAEMINEG